MRTAQVHAASIRRTRGPSWLEALGDGTLVRVRPIGPGDAAVERAFLERSSERARHDRFVGVARDPGGETVARLVAPDRRALTLIALTGSGSGEIEVGAASYHLTRDGRACHCAVAIDDAWRGRGLGSLLMAHLIECARRAGVERMYADDAVGSEPSHRLATGLGFRQRLDPEDPGALTYELLLEPWPAR